MTKSSPRKGMVQATQYCVPTNSVRARTTRRVVLRSGLTPPGTLSVCAGVAEDSQYGERQDPQIEPQRPVPHVIQVVGDSLIERRVAAEPVHLCPAGDSRLHVMAHHVARNLLAELLDVDRALGP